MWIRKHARPRDGNGRFRPGYQLWTRYDGSSRWVFWPNDEAPEREHLVDRLAWLDDDAHRMLVRLAFVLLVAVLLAVFVR